MSEAVKQEDEQRGRPVRPERGTTAVNPVVSSDDEKAGKKQRLVFDPEKDMQSHRQMDKGTFKELLSTSTLGQRFGAAQQHKSFM